VKHRSPKFAKSFLDLVLREINSLSRVKDQKEASAAIDYLNTLLVDTLEKDMRNMLTGMIQSQVKTQMLSEIKDNYVLEPIDTPYLPLERTSPQRTRLVLLGTLLGFIIALLISIFRYYGTKYKFFNS
jgi:LPS O-antigen subunit length determinant protein (WzzB/FepE family)